MKGMIGMLFSLDAGIDSQINVVTNNPEKKITSLKIYFIYFVMYGKLHVLVLAKKRMA